ncbi:MAG: PH domain-containing protein [Phycisphaerales bacterium]
MIAETPAPAGTLVIPDGELIILRIKPSLWYIVSRVWVLILLGAVLASSALSTVGTIAGVATPLPFIGWTLAQAVSRLGVMILFASATVVIWRFLEWWCKTYVLTDRRIVVQTGVLRQTTIDIPLRRIQHVALHRNIEQRVLGLGTLIFSTAGPSGEFAWLTISHPAERLQTVRQAIERYGRGNNGL